MWWSCFAEFWLAALIGLPDTDLLTLAWGCGIRFAQVVWLRRRRRGASMPSFYASYLDEYLGVVNNIYENGAGAGGGFAFDIPSLASFAFAPFTLIAFDETDIGRLPNEVLFQILSLLNAADLIAVASTSAQLRLAAADAVLWRCHCDAPSQEFWGEAVWEAFRSVPGEKTRLTGACSTEQTIARVARHMMDAGNQRGGDHGSPFLLSVAILLGVARRGRKGFSVAVPGSPRMPVPETAVKKQYGCVFPSITAVADGLDVNTQVFVHRGLGEKG